MHNARVFPLAALLGGSVVLGLGLSACASKPSARLSRIYGGAELEAGPDRAPVIVIPGILGTRLVTSDGRVAWGAFTHGAVDVDFAEGARTVALPMAPGVPLAELSDDLAPDGVLERVDVDLGLFRIQAIEPYRHIIQTLAAGRYLDRDIARAQQRSKGGLSTEGSAASEGSGAHAGEAHEPHYTCFQFAYDWRRDITENARVLDELVRAASARATAARGGGPPVKVDIVAHSMGGLVARYYLMYGPDRLPDDGSLPPVTWAGAALVDRAILVGTPSAGSVLALRQLVEGASYGPFAPTYRPALLGTMPAVYQLMPRARHARVIERTSRRPVLDLYDVATWERYGWGLADPDQDPVLEQLLPDVPDAAERRRIALAHLKLCLDRARQLHAALDVPSSPPPGLTLHLFAGDAEPTASVLSVDDATGRLRIDSKEPGDETVTRASALMDERLVSGARGRLVSPVAWDSVTFLDQDHLGLTRDDGFTDNLLYLLLEAPRMGPSP